MPDDATVLISGESLPAFGGDPNSDAAIGLPAPGLTGRGFDGQEIAVTNDGRPKVVLFLAHWCPHCQREFRSTEYSDDTGFPEASYLPVATSYNSTQPTGTPSWSEREGWTFPTVVDLLQHRFHALRKAASVRLLMTREVGCLG